MVQHTSSLNSWSYLRNSFPNSVHVATDGEQKSAAEVESVTEL